ncbi:MAG: DUF1015 domain-containing protein, partial [Candidatus Neomarinimicrobiota bacterium]|nr:DUF1015 domain-containing protein [Candidatus Neomarinimicrobiota bacterium]
MPEIYPFKGWRFNTNIVGDISQVIAPPYDVINKTDQAALYDRSPYNYVRIILNSSTGMERYSKAAKTFSEWKKNDILRQDTDSSIYLLCQTFRQGEQQIERTGFIANLKITKLGGDVLPHEQTISKHINDRYNLMKSTKANTGQIFMSYRDQTRTVETILESYKEEIPLIEAVLDGIQYRLWRMIDEGQINTIQNVLAGTKAIIADGHHRYKTAYQYAQDHPEINGSDRVMVTLVNAYNDGMHVLPTHRIVCGKPIDDDQFIKIIKARFDIEKKNSASELLSEMDQYRTLDTINLGVLTRVGNAYLLRYKGKGNWSSDLSTASQALDVNILHQLILEPVCGIDTKNQHDLGHLDYIRG